MKLPKRYKKYGVGKLIGGCVYLHKNYEKKLPVLVLQEAKKRLPDSFDYTVIKYNIKTNAISFIESTDFDTNPEPTIGKVFVASDNKILKPRQNPPIYHHKWLMVDDDYTGFDVAESIERSKQWMSLPDIDYPRIGYLAFWQTHVLPRLEKNWLTVLGQTVTSKNTSVNQVPALFKIITARHKGSINFDNGAGKYSTGTLYLAEHEIKNIAWDPFHQPIEERQKAQELAKMRQFDTSTTANILNIIDRKEGVLRAIARAAYVLKPEGIAYFSIYEGDKSGIAKYTSKGYQANQKTTEYLPFIKEFFKDVIIKKNIITASGVFTKKWPAPLF